MGKSCERVENVVEDVRDGGDVFNGVERASVHD